MPKKTKMNENNGTAFMELEETELTEMISINAICRLCANQNDKLIGIYSEDGINNDLANKMNLYLPIKVNETDTLPLQCCWQCASTVLAWHDLVIASVEAERRLRSYQFVTEKQLHDGQVNFPTEESCHSEKQDECLIQCEEIKGDYFIYDALLEESNSQTTTKKSVDSSSTCSVCCKIFSRKSSLNRHMKEIHDTKFQKHRRKRSEIDATFACPSCGKCYTRKFDMLKHVRNKHPKDIEVMPSSRSKNMKLLAQCKVTSLQGNYYKCNICDRSFSKSYGFIRHRNIHNKERMFCCHICGKSFIVSGGLIRHINQHHYGIKKFSCTVCGRKFCSKTARNEHMNIHNDVRPFVCDACGKSFKQNSSLHIHKMFHTNIFPFPCNICDKKFRRNSDLKVHRWTHTGEKPHHCNRCEMSFRSKRDLKIHSRIHAHYLCQVCGLEFQQERLLTRHSKSHQKTN